MTFVCNGTTSDTLCSIKDLSKYFSPSISDYTNCMACLEEFDLKIDNDNANNCHTGFCASREKIIIKTFLHLTRIVPFMPKMKRPRAHYSETERNQTFL